MDEVIKEAIKGYGAKIVGVDDRFEFHCTECGKCRTNCKDILLTPRDMFRAAKELNMTVKDFCFEYCELYIGENSRLPVICAMFPVGRMVAIDQESGEKKTTYLIDPIICGYNSQTRTVRERLLESGVPVYDKFFYKWHEQVGEMHLKVKAIEGMCSAEIMRITWDLMSILLYFNYDIDEPFDDQFDYNMHHLNKMLDGLLAGKGADKDERREKS